MNKYYIIGLILAIFAFVHFSGTGSLIQNVNNIHCQGPVDVLTCVRDSTSTSETVSNDGHYSVTIDQYMASVFDSNIRQAWAKADPTVDEFFKTHSNCFNALNYGYYSGSIDPKFDFIASQKEQSVLRADDSCGAQYYQYSKNTVIDKFSNQLIIVSGSTVNNFGQGNKIGSFKTYGFCDFATRECSLKIPDNVGEDFSLTPSSIKIYMKYGGFKDDASLCIEDGIEKCNGQNLQVCSGFAFIDKGKVEGKCGVSSLGSFVPSSSSTTGFFQSLIDFIKNLFSWGKQ